MMMDGNYHVTIWLRWLMNLNFHLKHQLTYVQVLFIILTKSINIVFGSAIW